MHERITAYRDKAETLRREADAASVVSRLELLALATKWEDLASFLERDAKRAKPPGAL